MWKERVATTLRAPSAGTLATAAAVIAFLPRALTATASFITTDEPLWMTRSHAFSDAIARGDLAQASARAPAPDDLATMPGVTTMWLGTIARLIWGAAHWTGLAPHDARAPDNFSTSSFGLDISQGIVAVTVSALIGLVVWLVARWVGRTAAVTAGLILATEPFLVAHGAVLHTDELFTLLGVSSLLCLLIGFRLPTRPDGCAHGANGNETDGDKPNGRGPAGDRRWLLASGCLFGASWLTKLSALMFGPCIALIFLWALWGRTSEGSSPSTVARSLAQQGFRWLGSALVTIVVLYPALWVDPVGQLDFLTEAAALRTTPQPTFFLGEPTDTPGLLFYLVALPVRVTPWFLLLGAAAAFAVWGWRSTRGFALAATLMAAPIFVVISTASKQLDRYGLPLVAIAAVVTGIAAQEVPRRIRQRAPASNSRPDSSSRPHRRWQRLAGTAAAMALAHTLLVAPWGLVYFNPLTGGSAGAEARVPIGWSEGMREANQVIQEHAGGDCSRAPVLHNLDTLLLPYWQCGSATARLRDADYVVVYIGTRQRWTAEKEAWAVEGRELIGTVEKRGLTLAQVYGPIE